MKRILLPLFLSIVYNIFSQQSYVDKYSRGEQKGYIILENGEKKEGLLKVKGKMKNQKKILFFDSPSKSHEFLPNEIVAYGFGNVKFESINNEEFRQIIEDGCLKIYVRYYTAWWIGISSGIPIAIPYRAKESTKRFKDENITYLYGLSFRKEWGYMLSDNLELSDKIYDKEYRKRDYLTVTRLYNKSCSQ